MVTCISVWILIVTCYIFMGPKHVFNKTCIDFFQYNECELYTQLSFFQHIFDLSKVTDKRKYNIRMGQNVASFSYGRCA